MTYIVMTSSVYTTSRHKPENNGRHTVWWDLTAVLRYLETNLQKGEQVVDVEEKLER